MIRKLSILLIVLLFAQVSLAQEDALNLPTELYVLTNSGQVLQYGVGMAGLSQVSPENEFVLDFGIAPDGNWMAYRTETGLKLVNIYTPDEIVEVEGATAGVPPVRGRGDTVAWSPAGDAVVYTTPYGGRVYFTNAQTFLDLREGQFSQIIWSPNGDYLAAEADQGIWWLYRREGNNLVLHSAIPSAVDLTWVSPSQVAFAPADGGLIRMDLAAANAQTPLLDNTWTYTLPYLLSNGTIAVYGRQKDDTVIPEGSGRLIGLTPDTLEVQGLGDIAVELNGLEWAPGGQLMVAFRGGVMAAVIPATGQGLALPVSDAVAYSWGPRPLEQVAGVPLPANGYFIAPGAEGTGQVWWLPGDGSAAQPITEAPGEVTAFAMSPDERNVAYVSDNHIWLKSLNSSNAESLVDLTGETFDLTFSPDGTRLAYATGAVDGSEGGIWVAPVSGETELVLENGAGTTYQHPQFAPNVNALLAEAHDAIIHFILLDLGGDVETEMGGFDDAIWLRDGRILGRGSGVITTDTPPAAQALVAVNPADNSRVNLASLQAPTVILTMREVAPGRVRLVFSSDVNAPQALTLNDLDTTTGALTPAAAGGFMVNPALSPDGTVLAGQTRPDGPLTFRDLTTGRQIVLNSVPNARDFQWGFG